MRNAPVLRCCDMVSGCKNPITRIGEKGYVYCASCAPRRRGLERCRKMRKWELELIAANKPLPSFTPQRKPKPAALNRNELAYLRALVASECDFDEESRHLPPAQSVAREDALETLEAMLK